jgi:hypothetical protein
MLTLIHSVVPPLPALRLHEVRDSRFDIGPQQLREIPRERCAPMALQGADFVEYAPPAAE